MRTAVQILFICILLPVMVLAREETLEERKQRITRKYLRERMNISQSDMYVPVEELPEDEQVTASERIGEDKTDIFERHEGVSAQMPPPQRMPVPPPQQTADDNWLFGGEEETLEDPYADPFAIKKSDQQEQRDLWRDRYEPYKGSYLHGSDDSESRYGRQEGYNPYSRGETHGTTQSGFFGSETEEESSRYGYSSGFGTPQQSPTYGGIGARTTYGSTPESGLLNVPSTQPRTDDPYSRPSSGYTPYTPSYQTPSQQQRTQPGGSSAWDSQQQEYQQPDRFQQYKQKRWDPSQSESAVDEMMRRNR